MFEDIDWDNTSRGKVLYDLVEQDRDTKPEGWDTFEELCFGENWAGRPRHYDITGGYLEAIEFAANSVLKDGREKQKCRIACLHGMYAILSECSDDEFPRFIDAIFQNRNSFGQSLYFSMGGHGTGLWDPPSGIYSLEESEHGEAFRNMDEYIDSIEHSIGYMPSDVGAMTTDESEYFEVECSANHSSL